MTFYERTELEDSEERGRERTALQVEKTKRLLAQIKTLHANAPVGIKQIEKEESQMRSGWSKNYFH